MTDRDLLLKLTDGTRARRFAAVGTVLLLLVSFAAVAAPAQILPDPIVALDPDTGPPGTPFVVDGRYFSPLSPIEVRWGSIDGEILDNGMADLLGEFTIPVAVPDDAPPGLHRVFACVQETGPEKCRQLAGEVFTVTAPPTTTVTTRPPATSSTIADTTTTIPESTTTSFVDHGAGTDDYSFWATTSSSSPSYGYTGPSVPPTFPPEAGVPDIEYPDLRVTAVEVTQGMQNLENAMPLVKGRRTFVRVHVDIPDDSPNIDYVGEINDWPLVTGAVGVWSGNTFLGTRWPENGFITAHDDGGERVNLNDSLYFRIPLSWTNSPQLRFTAMIWATHPSTIEEEERADNNEKTVFVDFHNVADVTVHPVPLHLHRSYHATDEVRVYQGVFGGPGVFAGNTGGNMGALDVVEGIYRYHPVKSVSIEPWASVLYPLNHHTGEEWNLGPCQTVLTDIIQPGNSGYRNFLWVSDAAFFFDEGEEPEIGDFTKPDRLVPDRTQVKVLDKVFEIDDIAWDSDRGAYELRGEMPLPGEHPVVGSPVFVTGCKKADYGQASAYGAPLSALGLNRIWYDWDSHTEFFIGMVDPSLPSYFSGLANSGHESTWVKFNTDFSDDSPWFHGGASTTGHEVGHLANRKHVACADSDGDGQPNELKGGAIDLSHPMTDWFPDCRIAEVDEEGWYGFDVYYQMWGLPEPTVHSNDPAAAVPNLAYPVMSYLSPKVTDPYHWCRLLSYYGVDCEPNLVGIDWNPPPPASTDGDFGTPTGPMPFDPVPGFEYQAVVVTGTVDTNQALAEMVAMGLTRAWTIEEFGFDYDSADPSEAPSVRPGVPVIEVYGPDDQLLYRTPMDVDDAEEVDDVIQATSVIPMAEGHSYTVVLDSVQIDRFEPSSAAPTGRWITQHAESDLVFLQWEASDADGDYVLTSVQHSINGEQWTTLATGQGLLEYRSEAITSSLPGGAGQFRVLLSDGFHTTVLEGPRLELGNKPPAGVILLPNPGFVFATNEEIGFQASVFDIEDRGIDPDNVVWRSSIDGEFGRGLSFDYGGLTPGEHEITVEARDSAGVVTVMVIPLEVDPDVVKPLPDAELASEVEALLLAVDETTATTVPVAAGETGAGLPVYLWLIIGAAAAGGAIIIGRLWNSRSGPSSAGNGS